MLTNEQIKKLETASLEESLLFLASCYPGQVVFSSSLGQEDQVITDSIFTTYKSFYSGYRSFIQ
jgi:phosphoadenosine phosphosulfate reductase